jgi:hypothetical protein
MSGHTKSDVYCPNCLRNTTVSRMRLVSESVDLSTREVLRRDLDGWTNKYECACGHEWRLHDPEAA